MNNIQKLSHAYKTIGEVTKELSLIDKKTGQLQTHTIRYWETKFRQIRPVIGAGKRRYYSEKDLKIIKFIKFLLKDRGLTINGVKKILSNTSTTYLDDEKKYVINNQKIFSNKLIKDKIKNISKIIKELKKL
ncbi:MerR family transcriptional regulator [Pelagibacteraceae bacterium]|nr:MerR family transcriptional regulator [Pelagibacteraceae bacterium]